jgi:hypothetical protein
MILKEKRGHNGCALESMVSAAANGRVAAVIPAPAGPESGTS